MRDEFQQCMHVIIGNINEIIIKESLMIHGELTDGRPYRKASMYSEKLSTG